MSSDISKKAGAEGGHGIEERKASQVRERHEPRPSIRGTSAGLVQALFLRAVLAAYGSSQAGD